MCGAVLKVQELWSRIDDDASLLKRKRRGYDSSNSSTADYRIFRIDTLLA
jgi:hypothetical protein